MTGLVFPWANTVNSRLIQARVREERTYPGVATRPSSPNRWGITAVNPASTTVRPKVATAGVMPGISLITMTAGPDPAR